MNIIAILTASFASLRTALHTRAGTLDDLVADARRLKARALLIVLRNEDLANDLENQRAAMEARIAVLDCESDEAALIARGAGRLIGEA
jgi:hypothetical protein